MSFSSEIKQELSAHVPPARHCRLAEMAAILEIHPQIPGTWKICDKRRSYDG